MGKKPWKVLRGREEEEELQVREGVTLFMTSGDLYLTAANPKPNQTKSPAVTNEYSAMIVKFYSKYTRGGLGFREGLRWLNSS